MEKSQGNVCSLEVKKVIWAGLLGNALEFYDYTIYACFASVLALQFFPSEDPLLSLMATYGVYATGFILRPIGGAFLGRIGDLYGRKRALEISILLMALPTLCIGFLPTYYQAGVWGPILLIFLRMLQGVSVGGEIVGSYAFLTEHAPESQKGFVGSWSVVGAFGGKWIGTLVAALMTAWLSAPLLEQWGWRIPFIAGIVFALMGFYLRKKVSETPLFRALERERGVVKSPLRETLRQSLFVIFLGIGSLVIHTSALHLLFVYLPAYFKSVIGLSYFASFLSNLLALTIGMIIMPWSAKLSDKIGRLRVLLGGTALLTAAVYPAFLIMSYGEAKSVILTHMFLAAIFGFMHGPFPAFFMELFPAAIRYTATAVSYNIGVVIFGGLSPVVATWLIGRFDNPVAPAGWLAFCGSISLVSLLKITSATPQCVERVK